MNNRFRPVLRTTTGNNPDIKRLREISICLAIDNATIDYRFKLIVDTYFHVCKGTLSKADKNSCTLHTVNVNVKIKFNVCPISPFFKNRNMVF